MSDVYEQLIFVCTLLGPYTSVFVYEEVQCNSLVYIEASIETNDKQNFMCQ